MKVLIHNKRWPPQTFIQRLMNGLVEKGVEFTVALPRLQPLDTGQPVNYEWFWAPAWAVSPAQRLRNYARLAQRFMRLENREKRWVLDFVMETSSFKQRFYRFYQLAPYAGREWDVVYFPWLLDAAELLPLMKRFPTVVSCRGRQVNVLPYLPNGEPYRQKLATIFQLAHSVHCVSRAIEQDAIRAGMDPARSHIIRPAVNPQFFAPLPDRTEGNVLRLISVGTLRWSKGHEYALLAMQALAGQGLAFRYDIIGAGLDQDRLRFAIRDLGLTGQAHLLGKRPPEEVRDRLQQADIFVLPSLTEGIANVALEAMACGLPVVVTDSGGMVEAVRDGLEGRVVPVRDPQALADAVMELAGSPGMRAQMGRAGRQRVIENFNLNEQVERFYQLLSGAAARLEHA